MLLIGAKIQKQERKKNLLLSWLKSGLIANEGLHLNSYEVSGILVKTRELEERAFILQLGHQ